MAKFFKTAAIGLAAASMVAAAPASATIFEYDMTNGDVLTIDTDTGTGTWVGSKIDAQFTGDFSTFQGGENPSFMALLTSLDGTRTIGGVDYTDNPGSHPQKIKFMTDGRVNLWSHWGDPIRGGDYVKAIGGFSVVDVPAPGMLGLFGLALAALGLGWRRRKTAAA